MSLTNKEKDLLVDDLYECIKTFVSYCPDASDYAATKQAVDYVSDKYKLSKDQIFKAKKDAKRIYDDVTRKSK